MHNSQTFRGICQVHFYYFVVNTDKLGTGHFLSPGRAGGEGKIWG